MRVDEKIRLSVLYSSFVATLALYFGIGEIMRNFMEIPPYYYLLSFLSLYPLIFLKDEKNMVHILILIALFLLTLGTVLFLRVFITGDFMGGFVLILSSSLLFTGMRDTYYKYFSGLSYYIVGLFLLLGDSLIVIFILFADLADYYINCIGENCTPYKFMIRPEIILFFFAIFAIYPFLTRNSFRRKRE